MTGTAFAGCHQLCPLCSLRPLRLLICSCCSLSLLLPEDSSSSLFKDLSSALAGMPEVSLNMDTPFPLEEELQIEPLSLDGLNMLSDSSMGLLDPSVEETFRADRLWTEWSGTGAFESETAKIEWNIMELHPWALVISGFGRRRNQFLGSWLPDEVLSHTLWLMLTTELCAASQACGAGYVAAGRLLQSFQWAGHHRDRHIFFLAIELVSVLK